MEVHRVHHAVNAEALGIEGCGTGVLGGRHQVHAAFVCSVHHCCRGILVGWRACQLYLHLYGLDRLDLLPLTQNLDIKEPCELYILLAHYLGHPTKIAAVRPTDLINLAYLQHCVCRNARRCGGLNCDSYHVALREHRMPHGRIRKHVGGELVALKCHLARRQRDVTLGELLVAQLIHDFRLALRIKVVCQLGTFLGLRTTLLGQLLLCFGLPCRLILRQFSNMHHHRLVLGVCRGRRKGDRQLACRLHFVAVGVIKCEVNSLFLQYHALVCLCQRGVERILLTN